MYITSETSVEMAYTLQRLKIEINIWIQQRRNILYCFIFRKDKRFVVSIEFNQKPLYFKF